MTVDKILDRKWYSLTQLKEQIEKSGEIKILDFNGSSLITSVGRFILYDEKVYLVDIK